MLEKIKSLICRIYKNIVEVALITSIALLGGAYSFEYFGGLYPCDLCWPQRYAHMAIVVFASFALYMRKNNPAKWLRFKILTLFSAAVSVGYSGYHAGVEQKWWEGPDSCTLQTDESNITANQFFQTLDNIAFVRCDDIPWELFGISMAGYNFLISLGLFVMLFLSVRQDLRK